MVDWHKRYLELADLYGKLHQLMSQADFINSRISYHIEESDRLRLREQNKRRFCRLLEDVEIAPEYICDEPGYSSRPKRLYKAGTLIQAKLTSQGASVYLDHNGDGMLYFPAAKLEEVEIEEGSYDSNAVVWQG